MFKYFCDKCGKEVGEFEAYTILVEAPEIKSWADQYMYERRGYQVCRDCMAKVADFIESNPTKKFEDEPQTEKCDRPQMDCESCWKELHCRVKDEPQTERSE